MPRLEIENPPPLAPKLVEAKAPNLDDLRHDLADAEYELEVKKRIDDTNRMNRESAPIKARIDSLNAQISRIEESF